MVWEGKGKEGYPRYFWFTFSRLLAFVYIHEW